MNNNSLDYVFKSYPSLIPISTPNHGSYLSTRKLVIYSIIAIAILIYIVIVYYRLSHKFWAIQPVWHYNDLYYIFYNPHIVRIDPPDKTRYCNFDNINTVEYSSISDNEKEQFVDFIRSQYFNEDTNVYQPSVENISPYLKNSKHSSYISLYMIPQIVDNVQTKELEKELEIVGSITSRSLNVYLQSRDPIYTLSDLHGHTNVNNASKSKTLQMPVYYVDNLCVDKKHRNRNIATNLIQTHIYNHRYKNTNIVVCLFKREDELTNIVPACTFTSYCFRMHKWGPPNKLPPNIKVVTCTPQTIYYFYDFLDTFKSSSTTTTGKSTDDLSLIITPDIESLGELITTNNLFVFLLMNEETKTSIATFVFRKVCTFIDKDLGEDIIASIASLKAPSCPEELFIAGFKNALWSIIGDNGGKHSSGSFKYLSVETISHNSIIYKNLRKHTPPVIRSKTAYFWYNFIHHPLNAKDVFIIN